MSLFSRYLAAAAIVLVSTSVAHAQASPWRDSKALRVPDSTSGVTASLGKYSGTKQSLPPLLAVRQKSDVNRAEDDVRPSCAMPLARNAAEGRDSMPVSRRGVAITDPMPVAPSQCRSGQ
jgi:hypothetical protein